MEIHVRSIEPAGCGARRKQGVERHAVRLIEVAFRHAGDQPQQQLFVETVFIHPHASRSFISMHIRSASRIRISIILIALSVLPASAARRPIDTSSW